MKKIILTSLACFCCLTFLMAQNQSANLEKYWNYRQRLRQRFIVVDQNVERLGVNIPASSIDLTNSIVGWGDANNSMSHYLSLLATELWLLKNNNQDYSETLKELYYAMHAMERMDLYSEQYYRRKANVGYWMAGIWVPAYNTYPQDRNGLHVRDDVSQGFWDFYKSHFPVTKFESVFMGYDTPSSLEEISQDNIFHNLEGLALINKLVGTESVAGIPVTFVNTLTPDYLINKGIQSGTSVNFALWAKDLTKRYIAFMQAGSFVYRVTLLNQQVFSITNHWALLNPVTGDFVREGSGKDFDTGLFYNAGVLKAGEAITGEDLRTQDAFLISNSLSTDLYTDLFRLGPLQSTLQFQPWPVPFNQFDAFKPININILFDDYKVRTLGTTANILGTQTLATLRANRDHSSAFDYEHMPLMYSAMHDPSSQLMFPGNAIYNQDRVLIENLLNSAPANGPTSNGNYNWSSESRLVWPEKLGERAGENIEFSGLDYMLLHNLYYIAFRREDFLNLVITNTPGNNALYSSGIHQAGTIMASNWIPSFGYSTYQARTQVILRPGFSAAAGSNFTAKVEPRTNNYQGALYKQPALTGGRIKSDEGGQDNYVNEIYTMDVASGEPKVADKTVITLEIEGPGVAAEKIAEVQIAPNPVNEILQINIPESMGSPVKVELFSSDGKLVFSDEIPDKQYLINVRELANGLYLLKLYAMEGVTVRKIMVMH